MPATGRTPLQRLAVWWRELSPATLLVLSFVLLIAIGTLGLLVLPGLYTGERLDFLDALFTMTSAACVTGLVVVDTASFFTRAGQLWLLLFIQLGGIGLVTLTTLIIGALGRQLSVRSEILTAPGAEVYSGHPVSLVLAVTKAVLLVEGVGALFLWAQWGPRFGAVDGLWHAVFYAVNAVCNAGFASLPGSLTGQVEQPGVLIVVALLIVAGSIGYVSGHEAVGWWRAGGWKQRRRRLSSHTWAVLVTTAALLLLGSAAFLLFEWRGVLAHLPVADRIVNAFFLSASTRSGGFNTLPFDQISNASAYLTILLMVVGGAPGSTAGGIKVTAFAILIALSVARFRGRRHVEIHQRTVPRGTVDRTVSLALLAFALMTAAIFVLTYTEVRHLPIDEARRAFLPLFFEVVSAFCTVGLSMDKTADLSAAGKWVVIALMFVGRVGLLSFFAALTLRGRSTLRGTRSAHADLVVG